MTLRGNETVFLRGRRSSAAVLALVAGLALSACASATIEDAVPQGAIDTGSYPNLNIPPVAAAEQLTPQERDAATAELLATQAQLAARTPSAPADAAALRRLGETHAQEALSQIEQ